METLNQKSYFLVTGGAGGIGSAVCETLFHHGYTPIVGYNCSSKKAHELASELGGFPVRINLADEKSVFAAIEMIELKLGVHGVLKGVILGASPAPDLLPFASLSSSHLLNQYQVNVVGSQLLLGKLIKKFFRRSKCGIIVGILTRAMGKDDQLPSTGMGAYIIAKAALKSMLLVCAAEYSWLKVRTVSPGFTRTKMLQAFDSRYLEMAQAQEDFSDPKEIAQLIIQEILS